MTAATSQHLADVLRAAGFEGLAERAETDEFHDFLSNHALPAMTLDGELVVIIQSPAFDQRQRMAAYNIRQRLHDGDFDADLKESDDWADSPEGKDAFRRLAKGE